MRIVMTVFYLLLILAGISFAALNASSVPVNLYFTVLTLPIAVWMTMMWGLGILFGFFLFLCRYWRLKGELHKVKNQLKMTEKEIKNLRSIPLKDQH